MTLRIDEPENGRRFRGTAEAASVRLRGSVLSTGHGTLFYRWYSGIDGELNAASSGASEIQSPLTVGSHVLTFTAKDVQGDTPADIKSVQEAGMAGGPPAQGAGTEGGPPPPCVVHVFVATMLEPPDHATSSTTLNRSGGGSLTAVAPKQWGIPIDFNDLGKGYKPNLDYHGDEVTGKVPINKIRYRWRFRPSGPPANRASRDLIPTVNQLTFLRNPAGGDLMAVRYSGPLGGLDPGNYTLALRVEELVEGENNPTFGDETPPRAVVLT